MNMYRWNLKHKTKKNNRQTTQKKRWENQNRNVWVFFVKAKPKQKTKTRFKFQSLFFFQWHLHHLFAHLKTQFCACYIRIRHLVGKPEKIVPHFSNPGHQIFHPGAFCTQQRTEQKKDTYKSSASSLSHVNSPATWKQSAISKKKTKKDKFRNGHKQTTGLLSDCSGDARGRSLQDSGLTWA